MTKAKHPVARRGPLSRFRVPLTAGTDGEKGGAVIELAITAPMFVMFILGMIDLGRILMHHIVLTQLSYEAVRIAAYAPGITTVSECVCNYTNPSPTTNWPDSNSCTTLTYDSSKWEVNPIGDLCSDVFKLYGVHTYASDLRFTSGTVTMNVDYPYPDVSNNRWRFRISATLNSLFTNFLFPQITIRSEAVGPDLVS